MTEKEEKKVQRENIPCEAAKELPDKDLDNVSGGFLGITLIDTCPNQYDFNACYYRYGKCPNLVVHSENVQNEMGIRIIYLVCSCKKGCFAGISDTHTLRHSKLDIK